MEENYLTLDVNELINDNIKTLVSEKDKRIANLELRLDNANSKIKKLRDKRDQYDNADFILELIKKRWEREKDVHDVEHCYNLISDIMHTLGYSPTRSVSITSYGSFIKALIINKDCGYDMELIIDGKLMYKHPGWNNKMFVKAELMKQFIKITNVKVERLQDITGEDCLKEGIEEHLKGVQYGFSSNIGYIGQYPFVTPREAFASLIDRVSGKGTWDSNPWVWVYEFELTSNPNNNESKNN